MTYTEFYHEVLAHVYVWTIVLFRPYVAIVMCWMAFTFMHPKGLP